MDNINKRIKFDYLFDTLLDSVSDLVFLKDLNGIYIDCNSKFAELNGLPKEQIIGKNDYELYDKTIAERYVQDDANIINMGVPSDFEAWVKHPNGKPVFYSTLKSPYRDASGNIVGILSISRDSTEKKLLEMKLLDREKYLASILDTTHDCFWLIDFNGKILDVNNATCNTLGYSRDELVGTHIKELNESFGNQENLDHFIEELKIDSNLIETTIKKKNGNLIDVEVSASILNDGKQFIVCFSRDVTEKKNKLKYIQRLSYHDFLTGLYNKRYMEANTKRMDTESNLPISMILLDMNNLKVTNDTFGHNIGDQVIKEVAKTIKGCFRQDELVGRVGGDEFLIVLPNVGEEETIKIIRRIKDAISTIDMSPVVISLAAGYGIKKFQDETLEEVEEKADNMMYIDKINNARSNNKEMINTYLDKIYEMTPSEREHFNKVESLSITIGKVMGLSDSEISDLALAAKFHDIGKVSILESVLSKVGVLSVEEYNDVKKHSEIGYRILKSMEEYYGISKVVLNHHERWDGKGYPLGLKGEEIHLLSRIISVAEAYEVMTSKKGYGPEKTLEEAIKELEELAGFQFDPRITRIFIDKVIKKGF